MKKFLLFLLVLVVALGVAGSLFYWFQWKPQQVRAAAVKTCHQEANNYGYYTNWEPKGGSDGEWHDAKKWSKERYDEHYNKCYEGKLREKGVNK